MRGLTYAALLGSVPFGLAQHHYGPPRGGPRQGTKTWGGHGWGSSSTATSASASSTSGGDSGSQSCNMITSEDIESAGNNTLFTRWRPHSHFMAPAGWMNDPCAPIYDPKRDVYHLFYQWHPQHINWGNISWGYATSKDMITWEDYVSCPLLRCNVCSTSTTYSQANTYSFRMAGRVAKLSRLVRLATETTTAWEYFRAPVSQ